MNLKEIWKSALNYLQQKVSVVAYDLWIKSLEPIDIKDRTVYLSTTSETAKSRIIKLHSQEIEKALKQADEDIKGFVILDPDEKETHNLEALISLENTTTALFNFNNKYTFDKFVVGNSNKYVYAACRGVAENPFVKINPLFIYGGVGLGKTHLLHSIGNYLITSNPELKVMYATCERFTNDYIESLKDRSAKTSKFREKYRNVDVLMIDDIQFISNKTSTQEEFFHTFNDLHQNGKQIIIASDRSPKDIPTLEERLQSRFSMGLIQDIQSPDYETRLAILQKKAQQEKYSVSDEVIKFLAENCSSNVREMEGLLGKVCFYATLLGKEQATLEDVQESLKDQVHSSKPNVTANTIIDTVCNYFNVKKDDLVGKKKNKEIVEPRQLCMYLICDMLDLPLTTIGSLFGGRDHTTVIHARDKISEQVNANNRMRTIVADLKNLSKQN